MLSTNLRSILQSSRSITKILFGLNVLQLLRTARLFVGARCHLSLLLGLTFASTSSQVEASNATQPDGTTPVPWGVGSLVNNSETTSSAVAALTSPEGEESIVSAAWGILSGEEDQVESNSSAPINGTLANSTESTLQAGLSQTPTATALDGQWDPSSVANGQWQGQASTPTSSWNESTATSSVSHNITGFMQGPSCDIDNQCPEETPCCSEQRQCGTGRYVDAVLVLHLSSTLTICMLRPNQELSCRMQSPYIVPTSSLCSGSSLRRSRGMLQSSSRNGQDRAHQVFSL